jgi:large repetitive protein
MRIVRTTGVVALLAAVFAASAWAFGFTDEAQLPPDMHLGEPYSFQLSARSGCPPYYYEKQSGYFPPGVSMGTDGLINGTPQMGGTYQAWLAVKNQCPGDSSERLFSFYVVDPNPFLIRTPDLHPAVKGSYYESELISTEAGVLTWTLNAGALPPGIKLSPQGQLIGRPTGFGTFNFRVKVNDGRRTATRDLVLVVQQPFSLVGKTLRLRVGHSFQSRVTVRGGVAPFQWSIASGKLPRGVRFVRGEFRGRPQVPGTSRVTIRVLGYDRVPATATFVLSVKR